VATSSTPRLESIDQFRETSGSSLTAAEIQQIQQLRRSFDSAQVLQYHHHQQQPNPFIRNSLEMHQQHQRRNHDPVLGQSLQQQRSSPVGQNQISRGVSAAAAAAAAAGFVHQYGNPFLWRPWNSDMDSDTSSQSVPRIDPRVLFLLHHFTSFPSRLLAGGFTSSSNGFPFPPPSSHSFRTTNALTPSREYFSHPSPPVLSNGSVSFTARQTAPLAAFSRNFPSNS